MTANANDAQLVSSFLEQLDSIASSHPEFTDTDVREALHSALNRHFVWGHQYRSPIVSFGMHSEKGDRLVESAFSEFIRATGEQGLTQRLSPGIERLNYLQNISLTTCSGRKYDEFWGHVDTPLIDIALPDYLYEPGDYDG